MSDILPDCRPREAKGRVWIDRGDGFGKIPHVRFYCANCLKVYQLVPEENCTFAFWLCNPCVEKHGAVAGTYVMPDEVFWASVRAEQQERYGCQLNPYELSEVLKHENNSLNKLVREHAPA